MDLVEIMQAAVANNVEQINFDGGDGKPWILFVFGEQYYRDQFIAVAEPKFPDRLRALDDLWAEVYLPNDE